MSLRLKAKKYNIIWPIYLLKYILPIFFESFFGQTYLLIISLFYCKNGKSYYNSELSCRNNTYFYVLTPFSIFALIIQIFISFITPSIGQEILSNVYIIEIFGQCSFNSLI